MQRRKPLDGFVEDSSGKEIYGEASSWYQLVGPLCSAVDNEPGKVGLAFFSEQRYISSMGRVHGGMMSSFMDYLLFNAARPSWGDTMLATVWLDINFVGACPADVWVVGEGEVVQAGRNMAFVNGVAKAGDKVIVHGTGTFRKLGPLPQP